MKTKFAKKEGREALDMVSAIMEQKSTIDPPWIGKNILMGESMNYVINVELTP